MMDEALRALVSDKPVLTGVRTAGEALQLAQGELLHAGPPLADPRNPPAVLLSSAVLTLLYEGWASSFDEGERLIATGQVKLMPAQPRGCVTPLASIVSPSTPVFCVEGAAGAVHAPVSSVGGPDTRMGTRDRRILERLAQRDAVIALEFARVLRSRGPLGLIPMGATALGLGDDLHSRTTTATQLLAAWARPDAPELAQLVESNPLFFLTLWMAASAVVLRAAEAAAPANSTLVTRAGGNGESFGICLAERPDQWICVPGSPPRGRLADAAAQAAVCNAIGDSAVIDVLGCGGQALAGAPEPLDAFTGYLPPDHETIAQRVMCAAHPVLQRPVGLDAARVVEHRCPPLVALAMLGADGSTGFVGRGVYRPPVELFQVAP